MTKKITPAIWQRSLQTLYAVTCLYIGWLFYEFCIWAMSGDGAPVTRPAGVEGFLPISAFMGLKYFLTTGNWDPAHPAGLAILCFALLSAIFLRKGFCGYVCPVGLVSNLLSSLGRTLKLERTPPRLLGKIMLAPKYLALAFFVFTIWFGMSGRALASFLFGQYNMTADAHLMRFFLSPSSVALMVLGALAILTLFFRNAWCRWLCPLGALLGMLSWIGITRVHRSEACVHCGSCERACPARISIQEKKNVRTAECVGCTRCIQACGKNSALQIQVFGRPVNWMFIGAATVATFTCIWLLARATGHWHSQVPLEMLKTMYARALQ